MKHLIIMLILLVAPLVASAQSQEEEDKGYLTGLIEDNLSGVSREVNIFGFEGALSSEATIEVLTVADAEGVWLTLEDLVLTWNRGALFRGAIDVEQIGAARVIVARPPVAEESGPSPEAQPFSLPELPVSVSLGQLNVERIELGEAFLGEEIVISLTGTAELSGGEGSANVLAERLGQKSGVFEIDGSYSNETRVLGLLLNVEEAADGIAARLLDLPGRPSVGLQVEGTAPINDYEATIAIATDGQDRLTGQFGLTETAQGRTVTLDVGGDVSPLFDPAYQGFFGTDAQLSARARQTTDGRVDVSNLNLRSERLNLSGALLIGSQGWPELIQLTGGITAAGTEPVLLPIPGQPTFVDQASIDISYDSAASDDWRADVSITGFDRLGLGIETLSLQGGGILQSGEGDQTGQVTATLNYGAQGLTLDDTGAAQALGDAITGVFAAERAEGEPTQITRFTLNGAGIEAEAEATIAGPDAGFQTRSTATLSINGLGRFSTLVGQNLGGGGDFSLLAAVTPLDGLFDVVLTGTTRDLSVGIPEADGILAGTGTLSANAVRDSDGTRLEALRIETEAAQVTAEADLTSRGSTAAFEAELNDVSLVVPRLDGRATAIGEVRATPEGQAQFEIRATGPSANLQVTGTADPAETGQTINAEVTGTLIDLSRYAGLAQRPISGSASFVVNGVLLSDGLRFDANVSAQTNNLVTGIERADPLLAGRGVLSGQIARTAIDAVQVADLRLRTPALSIAGNAAMRVNGDADADLDLRISDASTLDPSLSGPITASVDINPSDAERLQVDLSARGPGASFALGGLVTKSNYELTGDLSAEVDDLEAYQQIIGQPVSGGVTLSANGVVLPDLSEFDTQVSLLTDNLQIGNPTADPLLQGTGRINATVGQADGVLFVRTLEVSTPQFSIVGALNGNAGIGQGRFNASLRNVGVLTDQISGPVRATGSASLDEDGNWGIDASGTGPGGLRAQVNGQIGQSGQLNIDVDGSAPLALANAAIDPRRLSGLANFDLGIDGPAQLSSLNGRITFSDGRLAAPTLASALSDIGGQISISNGSAQIGLNARVEGGGSIEISGPVTLNPPNDADIAIRLRDIRRRDRSLYSTTVDGTVTIAGPLQNGALIAGQLDLGQTDIRVPSSSISTLGELPDVIHIGESAAVRQTLERAGVGSFSNGDGSNGSARRAYPLDIVIDAPSRIFIRGRGVDAELGGSLTIGGTTNNVIPVGRFELLRGRIDILQQRFELTEGSATLQGDFDPFIRLVARTESATGTTISIIVEGSANSPEISFVSTPALPEDEILSQLIFGRDLESITPLQAVQLASAISTLAGRGGGAVDRLRRNIGLDDFDVTTDDEGATAVRAGKYLSENVYTDVTVTSEGETEINLNLDLTDQITAKGSVDQDGQTSVGIFFERDY